MQLKFKEVSDPKLEVTMTLSKQEAFELMVFLNTCDPEFIRDNSNVIRTYIKKDAAAFSHKKDAAAFSHKPVWITNIFHALANFVERY